MNVRRIAATVNVVPDLIICSIFAASLACMYVLAAILRSLLESTDSDDVATVSHGSAAAATAADHHPQQQLTLAQLIDRHAIESGWALKLLVNCFGYACVVVPGVLIYQYATRIQYLKEGRSSGPIAALVKLCFKPGGSDADNESPTSSSSSSIQMLKSATPSTASARLPPSSAVGDCALWAYCFIGLNVSYLSWGLLQEKIITQQYVSYTTGADGQRVASEPAHFRDSQFLVFVNRLLAFALSAAWLLMRPHCNGGGAGANESSAAAAAATAARRHRAPLFKYSYASLSNIASAWFQYEALKFVSFPTQVLAKSCKIMPVMLMGRIVSRQRYEFYEYLTAALISLGMVCFLLGSADGSAHHSTVTTLAGVLLLVLYLVADSFTSNWQAALFRQYGMSSVQMMCGVSAFSALFTGASLAVQGGFAESVAFAVRYPKFAVDCVVLSASSAVGQMFIFFTIARFGAVGFTIIMTVRQAIAILLSCIVYDHYISPFGIVGIVLVFVAIFMRVYCSQRLKTIKRKADAARGQRIGV